MAVTITLVLFVGLREKGSEDPMSIGLSVSETNEDVIAITFISNILEVEPNVRQCKHPVMG